MPKLVSLEPPENENSEYALKFVSMSVNETATKMSCNTISYSLGQGSLWNKLAHRDTGNSNTAILIKKIDSLLSPMTHILVTLSGFFLHISPKKRHKLWLLRKLPEVRIKLK
jgi:hypothetical protein